MQTSSLISSHDLISSSGFAIPRATHKAGRELRSIIYPKASINSSGLTLSLPLSSPLNPPLGIRRDKLLSYGWDSVGRKPLKIVPK